MQFLPEQQGDFSGDVTIVRLGRNVSNFVINFDHFCDASMPFCDYDVLISSAQH